MDRRKLQIDNTTASKQTPYQVQDSEELESDIENLLSERSVVEYSVQDIVNSKKVNQTLLHNANEMFEIENELKLKAQLRYLEMREKDTRRREGIAGAMRHDFLWSATPAFYAGSIFLYFIVRRRYKLQLIHIFPFMMIPTTLDFLKRDYYVKQFKEENKVLCEKRKIVTQIIAEKKAHVTFE